MPGDWRCRATYGHFLGGGLPERLRITADGQDPCFAVDRVEQVAANLPSRLAVGEGDEQVG